MGKADKKELQISSYLDICANNMTNLNQMSEVDDMTDYAQACICCTQSAIMSTIYDTCPNTEPSAIGADDWYAGLLAHSKWEGCGKYLEAYDCAGDLGFGAEDAGDTHTFYKPGDFPKNGTESLYNTGGVISTPVSGATFTWTYGAIEHPVTVESTDNVVTATATGTSGDSSTTASETGASSTKTGMAVSVNMPNWEPIILSGTLALAFF
ncbi:unnamed protein product [Penicillium pancosmium]